MKNRIQNAFDGVELNTRRKEEIIDNVINGSIKEREMKGKMVNFWQSKWGSAVVVVVALIVFVVVNFVMLGIGSGRGTTASNGMDGETISILESTNVQESEAASIQNESEVGINEKEEPTTVLAIMHITDFIDVSNIEKIRMSDGVTNYTMAEISTNKEKYELLLIKDAISGEKDEFMQVNSPNVYGEKKPLYCITFYWNTGADIIDEVDVQNETDIRFDELNIYSENEVSINGIHYNAEAKEFINVLKESLMEPDKFDAEISEVDFDVKIDYPVKGYVLTSEYGEKYGSFHDGICVTSNGDDNIYLPLGGTVTVAEFRTDDGNTIAVDHGNGVVTEYCHLEQMLAGVGDVVKAGEIIGVMGKTGMATGKCLHWRVIVNGGTVDPLEYVEK